MNITGKSLSLVEAGLELLHTQQLEEIAAVRRARDSASPDTSERGALDRVVKALDSVNTRTGDLAQECSDDLA